MSALVLFWRHLVSSWRHLGSSWRHLGQFWPLWAHLGHIWGALGAPLGPPWDPLGTPVGAILAHLGPSGHIWGTVLAHLGLSEHIWGALGAPLGALGLISYRKNHGFFIEISILRCKNGPKQSKPLRIGIFGSKKGTSFGEFWCPFASFGSGNPPPNALESR